MPFILSFELIITLVACILTLLNWLISQRINVVDTRLKRLEESEKETKDFYKEIHNIKGKLDVIITFLQKNQKNP
ncbi:hypothetical protein [Campylobacter geochelonis]|uniref:Uncharacterized protein n=1 Tax=Campylobacter geochelonis TaxID=1780362 RepID=A0A128EFK8_9BACT|nr:hypothetical protein [Campylobacter geochelonis]QKF72007.1 hypothetical protein CGEO_1736 [Campylobacter geochelonis]CZE47706.1 Uncharacterised protein [Campylobacter geochelonis]